MSPEELARQAAELAAQTSPGNARAPIRAAASVLFYECGEMPSANKLLKILGRGSLTTITDEIRSFWNDVRESAREELVIKGVPDRVAGALRRLAPAVWDEALSEARSEASSAIAAAEAEAVESIAAAARERDSALHMVEVEREAREAAVAKMESALVANEGLTATIDALREQIGELQRQRARSDEGQAALAEQLAQARTALQKNQESADSERRRLMQEVDTLRRGLKSAESSLDSQVAERTSKLSEAHSRELSSLSDRLESELKKNKHLQALHDAQVQTTSDLAKQYHGLVESMSGGIKQIEERVAGLAIQVAPAATPTLPNRKRNPRGGKKLETAQ